MTKRMDWEIAVDGNVRPFAVDLPFTVMANTQVTLTTASVAYLLPASEMTERRQIILYNGSSSDMYIGCSDLSGTKGQLLPSGGNMSLACNSGLYGLCNTAAKVINVWELK